ncbi:MAG: transposase [Actinomycetales bacterium]|nr:transposase [Actinomycetales bacterium]
MIEDLNVAGMTRNRSLARAISDAGFAEIRRQLADKTSKYGSTLVLADRFMPSSKTCSNCGAVKAKLPLSQRVHICDHCDLIVDRDLNAARNFAHLIAGSGPETQDGGGAEQKTRPVGQLAAKPQPRPRKASDVDRRSVTFASEAVSLQKLTT